VRQKRGVKIRAGAEWVPWNGWVRLKKRQESPLEAAERALVGGKNRVSGIVCCEHGPMKRGKWERESVGWYCLQTEPIKAKKDRRLGVPLLKVERDEKGRSPAVGVKLGGEGLDDMRKKGQTIRNRG